MSVEISVYTQQPAISALHLRELAERQGLALRFLDPTGMPLKPDVRLDEPMYGQGYVLIGWPAADTETTKVVEKALMGRDKPEVDKLGLARTLGWCSIGCAKFDLAKYEAALREDLEYEDDDDEETVPDDTLERMRPVKTKYHFRCGLRPNQCAELLQKVAEFIRDASDGFIDE
jgi:hypothetical protein